MTAKITCCLVSRRFSSSMAQMDQGWNLDIGELAYSPSARDLSDAKVHHMLSEELWKPYRRVFYFSFLPNKRMDLESVLIMVFLRNVRASDA